MLCYAISCYGGGVNNVGVCSSKIGRVIRLAIFWEEWSDGGFIGLKVQNFYSIIRVFFYCYLTQDLELEVLVIKIVMSLINFVGNYGRIFNLNSVLVSIIIKKLI